MTLTEFLLARIAEDEAVARAATDGLWRYNPAKVNAVDRGEAVFAGPAGSSAITIASTGSADDQQSMSDAAHIARHDPARVLAECESKRRIVALHSAEPGQHPDFCGHDLRELPCPTLRILALPDAAHPDYDPAWAI